MVTTIHINNTHCQLTDFNNSEVLKILDANLSYFVQGFEYTKAYQTGWWNSSKQNWEKWDGKNHLLDKKLKFPIGLLRKVKIILKNNNVDFQETDHRRKVPLGKEMKVHGVEERPYQKRVLDISLKKMGGIIQSATGSGKTIMITQLIANMNIKTMVYVIGIDLLYQMKETLEKILKTKVGIIGDGQVDVRKINVCTVWTASNALGKKYVPIDDEDRSKKERFNLRSKAKIKKAIESAELAIYDECHMLATETLQSIHKNSKNAYYKFGLSGTVWRDDGADLLIEAVCGETIVEVTATELIKAGYLVQPTIHFMNVPPISKLPEKYPSIYKEYIVENEVRNNKIVGAVEKLVESGRKVLVLVKIIRHGEILLEELQKKFVVYFVRGNVNSEERNQIRQDFIDGNIDVIVASVVYDQGIDLPNLDALVLAGSGKSSGRALQRLGRVIRQCPGKKDAIVLDFIDNAKYLLQHTAARMDIYRSEAGFKIKLPKKSEVFGGKEKGSKNTNKMQSKKRNGPVSW